MKPLRVAVQTAITVVSGSTFDTGTVTLTVGGVTAATYNYGATDTPSSVAEGLAGNQASGSLVTLTGVDDAVSIAAIATNASTDYQYVLQAVSNNPTLFPEPSFVYSQVSGSLPAGTSEVIGYLNGGANANTGGTPVYQYNVPAGGYDPASNLVNYTDAVMGTWSFSYDTLKGLQNLEIAEQMKIAPRTVNRWRERFLKVGMPGLQAVQPEIVPFIDIDVRLGQLRRARRDYAPVAPGASRGRETPR